MSRPPPLPSAQQGLLLCTILAILCSAQDVLLPDPIVYTPRIVILMEKWSVKRGISRPQRHRHRRRTTMK
jgi:hypothetical protein